MVHEAGHALAAVLSGRTLASIRLHSDTSGLTVSSGKRTGPGMVFTAAAGYPAPAIVGLAVAALIGMDRPVWALFAGLFVLALMLLHIRNWFGLFLILVVGTVTATLVTVASAVLQGGVAMLMAWFLLLAAPRPIFEMWHQRRMRHTRTSDVDILARITGIPALVWALLLLVFNVGALVLGTWLLLPGLPR